MGLLMRIHPQVPAEWLDGYLGNRHPRALLTGQQAGPCLQDCGIPRLKENSCILGALGRQRALRQPCLHLQSRISPGSVSPPAPHPLVLPTSGECPGQKSGPAHTGRAVITSPKGKLFVWKEMVQKEAVATLKIGPGPASRPSWSVRAEIPVAEESERRGWRAEEVWFSQAPAPPCPREPPRVFVIAIFGATELSNQRHDGFLKN